MTTELWQTINAETTSSTYDFGTQRAAPPAATLRRIRPLLPFAGITRLADVTGLDWIGLPVYQAIRPNSRNLSVSQGKGLTREQAQVSALMESIELFHSEEIRLPTVRATVRSMRRELNYDPYALSVVRVMSTVALHERSPDPYCLPIGAPTLLHDDTPLEWVAATDLCTGAASWVPKQLCDLDYCIPEQIQPPLFLASSDGLASGNTFVEALIHGLCEVIERDCLWRYAEARHDPDRRIAPVTVTSALAQHLLDRFAAVGGRMCMVDISGPTGLPCFEATLELPDAPTWYGGAGCHLRRATALIRALTEAAQSRLTMIAGSRDDISRHSYRPKPHGAAQLPTEARRSFRSAPTLALTQMSSTLHDIVARVRSVTGMAPLAVDLTRPEFGIPVVHVVAPGLVFDPSKGH
jgi:ribosomal protein S12 methylthiotransferase accessory factor